MKKVTTISLAVAAMLVCAAGARVVSAAERTSSEQDYKIVKTNNKNEPLCSAEEAWKPKFMRSIDGRKINKTCYDWKSAGPEDDGGWIFHASPQCAFEAAKEGNLERLHASMRSSKNFRLDMVDKYDRTLLVVAIRGRGDDKPAHPAAVKKILNNVKKKAAKAGSRCDQLVYDVKRYVNWPDVKGRTALWYAAEKGNAKIVKILLENGAEVNLGNLPDDVYQSMQKENGKKFLSAKRKTKVTVLMTAVQHAQKDDPKVVNLLLANGADVTAASEKGNTALHMAARRGYTEIAKALLNACQDKEKCLTARNEKQLTPWMMAKVNKQDKMADFLKQETAKAGLEITEADTKTAKEISAYQTNDKED